MQVICQLNAATTLTPGKQPIVFTQGDCVMLQSRFGHFQEMKGVLSLPGIEPRLVSSPFRCLKLY